MRDEIFAKQMQVLKQEGHDRTSVLEDHTHHNSTGRYNPVLLPAVDGGGGGGTPGATRGSMGASSTYSAARPHTFGTMSEDKRGNDEYRRYDSSRVRDGVANQAIADYYDAVQVCLSSLLHAGPTLSLSSVWHRRSV